MQLTGQAPSVESCCQVCDEDDQSTCASGSDMSGQQEAAPADGTGLVDVVVRSAGEKSARCTLCGDRLSASKFLHAHEAFCRGEPTNPLIAAFLRDPRLQANGWLEALSHPALHKVNQRNGFTRELTESLAMLAVLRRICDGGDVAHDGGERTECRDGAGADEAPSSITAAWHVVDLCCGKGFLATLIGVLYPHFRVTAVDKRASARRPPPTTHRALPIDCPPPTAHGLPPTVLSTASVVAAACSIGPDGVDSCAACGERIVSLPSCVAAHTWSTGQRWSTGARRADGRRERMRSSRVNPPTPHPPPPPPTRSRSRAQAARPSYHTTAPRG